MWWQWLTLEVQCECARYTRAHAETIQAVVERALARGMDPERAGVRLPWSRLPDSARAARAAYSLAWYHAHKRPKRRTCACGAVYEIPIRRGFVPRECPECRRGK